VRRGGVGGGGGRDGGKPLREVWVRGRVEGVWAGPQGKLGWRVDGGRRGVSGRVGRDEASPLREGTVREEGCWWGCGAVALGGTAGAGGKFPESLGGGVRGAGEGKG
jgi:hypothetical protein